MILTYEYLKKESDNRDINEASEKRIMNRNNTL